MADSVSTATIERRLFVVGVPRSGTTLLQSLLAAHSSLTSFTESHFFDRHFTPLPGLQRTVLTRDPLPRVRSFLVENFEANPPAGEHLAASLAGFRRLRPLLPLRTHFVARQLITILDQLALRRGAPGWIEKTPRHLNFLPFLEELLAKDDGCRTDFVHLVRGGLDVVASLHKASQHWERPYDLQTCVRRWNEDMARSAGRVDRPHDHFVVYEELSSDPEAVLRRLLDQLDLAWEAQILDGYGRESSRLVTPDESWKTDIDRTIQRSSTSSQVLTGDELEWARGTLHHHLYDELVRRSTLLSEPEAGRG